MRKIQLRLFDRRRNQNFWFHFCYIPQDLWDKYYESFKVSNMDAQIKAWIKQDFDMDITHMEDIYTAKEAIRKLYAEVYPDIYVDNQSDRQGWARVWLTGKLKNLLEVE